MEPEIAPEEAPPFELAEALTKALLVLDPDEGLALLDSLPEVEGLIVDAVGRRRASQGFGGTVHFEPIARGPDYRPSPSSQVPVQATR